MAYILLILSLNFISTAIVFNLINLIPEVHYYLAGDFNINSITSEMIILLLIVMMILIVEQRIRRFFSIPFYTLFAPLYVLIVMIIVKIINPTFEPLELMPGRMCFLGLYLILLFGYPFVENWLNHKFSRE